MGGKDELQTLLDALRAARRQTVGGPPEPEELLAYRHDLLAGEEREHFEARLAAHPEAARVLADLAAFPDISPAPGAPQLTGEELDRGWQAFQQRLAELPPAGGATSETRSGAEAGSGTGPRATTGSEMGIGGRAEAGARNAPGPRVTKGSEPGLGMGIGSRAEAGSETGPGSRAEDEPGPGVETGSGTSSGTEARAGAGIGSRAETGPEAGVGARSGAAAGRGTRPGPRAATRAGPGVGTWREDTIRKTKGTEAEAGETPALAAHAVEAEAAIVYRSAVRSDAKAGAGPGDRSRGPAVPVAEPSAGSEEPLARLQSAARSEDRASSEAAAPSEGVASSEGAKLPAGVAPAATGSDPYATLSRKAAKRLALAAALVLGVAGLAGLLLRRASLRPPGSAAPALEIELPPGDLRGTAKPWELTPKIEEVRLTLDPPDLPAGAARADRAYQSFEARVVDRTGKIVATEPAVRNPRSGAFTAALRREVLAPGAYEIELFGSTGSSHNLLATYRVRFTAGATPR